MLYFRILIISQLVLHTLSACELITSCLRRFCCCGFASANYVKSVPPSFPSELPDSDQVPDSQPEIFVRINELPDDAPLQKKVRISLHELRVLMVEDNEIALMVLRRFGKGIGFVEENVKCALNGTAGVREFLKHKPHLVFMDRNMPIEKGLAAIELRQELEAIGVLGVVEIKNGVDATLAIRKSQESLGIAPVIICISDDKSEGSVGEFTSAGADDFYHKPFSSGGPPLIELLETHFEFLRRERS